MALFGKKDNKEQPVETITKIWQEYRAGKDYLDNLNLFDRVETCHDFVSGDQWKGLQSGSERPPQLNVLYPMMKSATALVGQNDINIMYRSMNYGSNRELLLDACETLDKWAEKLWEKLKMDSLVWDILEDAYIGGDSFIYFYDDGKDEAQASISAELIDTVNIMLSDEQQEDIQKQEYILIVQRMSVEAIKSMARANGVKEEDLEQIQADQDTELQINGEVEVNGIKKATLVTKMWKEKDGLHFAKATKNVMVVNDTYTGQEYYPVAHYTWKRKKGLARGVGDIWDKIPNQISINKALYRAEQSVKTSAYPTKIYREQAIPPSEIKKLNQVGASIGIKGNADAPVQNVISYIQPANISPYAFSYWQDLINLTRDLSGAGDNLENINPERASGTAISQVREAKELNVNGQVNAFKQFVEDCALIWYDLLLKYSPNGVTTYDDDDNEIVIPPEILNALKIDVKIDIVASDTTFVALRDSALKEMLLQQMITFEEYTSALTDESIAPKSAFEKIVEERREIQAQQEQAQIEAEQQDNANMAMADSAFDNRIGAGYEM